MRWSIEETSRLLELVDELGRAWLEISKKLTKEFGREFTYEATRMKNRSYAEEVLDRVHEDEIEHQLPTIGLIDVETLPAKVYTWKFRDINYVDDEMIIDEGCMLGWAGEFLGEDEIQSDILTPKEALKLDDRRVAKSCWEFISQCDIIVAHNLDYFDMKEINTCFLKHELPPLKPLQLDTLKVARSNFRFKRNKMGSINKELGLETKKENEGFRLWRKCREGIEEALEEMREYNKQDIVALKDLFNKIKPYISNQKFNVGLYVETDGTICPACGGRNLKEEGHTRCPAGKYPTYRCKDCMGLFKGKKNLLDKKKRDSLLVPFK